MTRQAKTYMQLVEESLRHVRELMPWDLAEELEAGGNLVIVDIREPYEFEVAHIPGSVNVPRGVLEPACDWGFEETVPELVQAREREIVLVCRSGHRSVFAAEVLQQMGYHHVRSLRTGVRGWNDYEQPLQDGGGAPVDIDDADDYFNAGPRPEQLRPVARD